MGIVTYLGDPARHFWLTRSVARSLGISLSDAMADNRLSAQGYAEMVTRCRQCTHVSDCEQWLAVHGSGADVPPKACLNAAQLSRLKR